MTKNHGLTSWGSGLLYLQYIFRFPWLEQDTKLLSGYPSSLWSLLSGTQFTWKSYQSIHSPDLLINCFLYPIFCLSSSFPALLPRPTLSWFLAYHFNKNIEVLRKEHLPILPHHICACICRLPSCYYMWWFKNISTNSLTVKEFSKSGI